jgi:TRAP-type mannitol/chloroaromatic compound transport system substrate-binding protein
VQLRAFPRELMDAGFKAVMATMAEHEAKSAQFKKIHRSLRGFQHDQLLWGSFLRVPLCQLYERGTAQLSVAARRGLI